MIENVFIFCDFSIENDYLAGAFYVFNKCNILSEFLNESNS